MIHGVALALKEYIMRSKKNEVSNKKKLESMRKLTQACNAAIKAGKSKKSVLVP